ncbi:MAG: CoA ester lyase [Enhydrobacter sp.]|nr:MAG: CoA ester lyase [Enhydrobacter sp.]
MAADVDLVRVLLFTPATHLEYVAKAAKSGADGLVIDLEDGVALDAKDAARKNLLTVIEQPRTTSGGFLWCVRLNHITTMAGLADLQALAGQGARFDAVMLPKVESPHEVEIASRHLGLSSPSVLALIETGLGLEQAAAIAAHPHVAAMVFGGADLAADLHAELAWEPMLWARSRICQAAASRGLPAFDVPFLDIHDGDGLKSEAAAAKRLGFSCKLAIHPSQVEPIKSVFAPTPDELARAKRIVEAYASAKGAACQVDGKMVDVPVWKAALRTVRLAAAK